MLHPSMAQRWKSFPKTWLMRMKMKEEATSKWISLRSKNQTWLRKKTRRCTQHYSKTKCLALTILTCCMRSTTAMKTTWMRNCTLKCRRNSTIMTTLRNQWLNLNHTSVDLLKALMHHLSTLNSQSSSSKIHLIPSKLQLRWTTTSQYLEDCSQTQ